MITTTEAIDTETKKLTDCIAGAAEALIALNELLEQQRRGATVVTRKIHMLLDEACAEKMSRELAETL